MKYVENGGFQPAGILISQDDKVPVVRIIPMRYFCHPIVHNAASFNAMLCVNNYFIAIKLNGALFNTPNRKLYKVISLEIVPAIKIIVAR